MIDFQNVNFVSLQRATTIGASSLVVFVLKENIDVQESFHIYDRAVTYQVKNDSLLNVKWIYIYLYIHK